MAIQMLQSISGVWDKSGLRAFVSAVGGYKTLPANTYGFGTPTPADPTLSGTQTTALAGANFGAALYTRGIFVVHVKSGTALASGVVLGLVGSQSATFASGNVIGGTVVLPSDGAARRVYAVGFWDTDPTPVQYLRAEVVGDVALGGTITLEYDVIAVP